MADTAQFFAGFWLSLGNKEIDFDADTFKIMATTSAYTPNKAHRYKSDITNEVSGTNYTAGGIALSSVVFAYHSGTSKVYFDAADPAWAGPIPAARNFIVYDSTPATDATRPLIGVIIADSDRQPAGIQFNAPPAGGGNAIFAIPV